MNHVVFYVAEVAEQLKLVLIAGLSLNTNAPHEQVQHLPHRLDRPFEVADLVQQAVDG